MEEVAEEIIAAIKAVKVLVSRRMIEGCTVQPGIFPVRTFSVLIILCIRKIWKHAVISKRWQVKDSSNGPKNDVEYSTSQTYERSKR